MHIVIPDDYPPTYASLDQVDLKRLAAYGTVELHTTRASDRAELFEHLFAVRHLRHGFRRDEAHRVDVPEPGRDEAAQVFHFPPGRNFSRQTLPGVARTFDELDGFHRDGCY